MIRHAIMLMLLWSCMPSHAQLVDPTAPPPAVRDLDKPKTADNAEAPPPPEQRLQSILISPKRRIAVIDGKTVREGARHQGALVASVRATYVILQKDGVREKLRLYPVPDAKPDGEKQR